MSRIPEQGDAAGAGTFPAKPLGKPLQRSSRHNARAWDRSSPTAAHAPALSCWHVLGVSIPAALLGQQSPRRGSSNEHHLPPAVTAGTGREDGLLLLFPLLTTQTSGLRQRQTGSPLLGLRLPQFCHCCLLQGCCACTMAMHRGNVLQGCTTARHHRDAPWRYTAGMPHGNAPQRCPAASPSPKHSAAGFTGKQFPAPLWSRHISHVSPSHGSKPWQV